MAAVFDVTGRDGVVGALVDVAGGHVQVAHSVPEDSGSEKRKYRYIKTRNA